MICISKVSFIMVLMFVGSKAFIVASSMASTGNKQQQFCTDQGGKVKEFVLWNGNAPGFQPVGVPIASPLKVCSFPNEAGTNVYLVSLVTLTSARPTLAVLAFQARVPYLPPKNAGSKNPASVYCIQLGGTAAADMPTSFLPVLGAHVGWWTKKASGSWDGVHDFCLFPDGSAIEPWMLMYHASTNSSANGIKFAYKSPLGFGK